MQGTNNPNAYSPDQCVQASVFPGEWLSMKDAAKRTGLSEKTLRRYMKKKMVQTRRLGTTVNSPIEIFVTENLKNTIDDVDVVSAEGVEEYQEEEVEENRTSIDTNEREPRAWMGTERETLRSLAEELVKPLVETIKDQTAALAGMQRELEEKDRQLRLLPDFQKQAEDERKAAELRALEVEALRKQIAALKEDQQVKEVKLMKVQTLESEVTVLTHALEKLQRPWWKQWFLPSE